jgi:hypothetical protein
MEARYHHIDSFDYNDLLFPIENKKAVFPDRFRRTRLFDDRASGAKILTPSPQCSVALANALPFT